MAVLFTSPTPHFFKIILSQTLNTGKLDLPKKFVRIHGDSLLDNQIRLSLPGGAIWDVELKKEEGKLWFESGWPEFMEFYSIQKGHFLVFRYKGNCSFHVVVFDDTATEIEYPVKKEVKDHDSSIDATEEEGVHSFGNEKMKMKKSEEMVVESKRSENNFKSKDEEKRVMEEANAFKSSTVNPSFMVTMRTSYVGPRRILVAPTRFFEAHLKGVREIRVRVSDGRVWKIRCRVRMARNVKKTELTRGWNRFVRDNHLQKGDICVFELFETSKQVFNVSIFRLNPQ